MRAGRTIGVPGRSLEGAPVWATNSGTARAGLDGEVRTANVLGPIVATPGGPTVLHDVTVPGTRANIDHIVVYGSRVLMVDSKSWLPGTYWSLFGRSFRGWKRVPHVEKATMVRERERLATFLRNKNVRGVRIVRPVVVVWPSSRTGLLSLGWLRLPGVRVMTGDKFGYMIRSGRFVRPAREDIVAALGGIVAGIGR